MQVIEFFDALEFENIIADIEHYEILDKKC